MMGGFGDVGSRGKFLMGGSPLLCPGTQPTWLKPDGTVRCVDQESFSRATGPEIDALMVYAVLVHRTRPAGVQECEGCSGAGWIETAPGVGSCDLCLRCSGLGWHGSLG